VTATLAHAPGLDGVRALAVLAVLGYHATDGLLPGGFIGVDVFFVLSGFLITNLLMFEGQRTRTISLRRFYLRRARRLLPALYTLLVVVAITILGFFPQYAAALRGDLAAAFGYVTNWYLIAQNSSYFGATAIPPVLNHLWSLAVEEQFYLIWPVVLLALGRLDVTRRTVVWLTAAAVLASALTMAVLYDPWGDPSRVYFGTDTRAAAPLLGAALAIGLRPWQWRSAVTAAARGTLDVVGLLALGGLGGVVVLAHDRDDWLYRGGFLGVAALAGLLVVVAAHPASRTGRVLGLGPLRWIGDRSYAIYLWHWPLCVVTAGLVAGDAAAPWSVVALRVGAALVLAHLSFHLIERPLRAGAIGRTYARMKAARGHRRRRLATRLVAGTTAVLVSFVGLGVALASATAPTTGGPVDAGPDVTIGPVDDPTSLPTGAAHSTATTAGATTQGPAPTLPISLAIFGDSQGMTLVINAPKDISKYLSLTDATVSGCGVLLGKVTSRSGERRDQQANCSNWVSAWRAGANRVRPQVALVMIGAWEVFDLTVGNTKLTFGTAAWDANFTTQLAKGITVLRDAHAQVALALLPCYRPIHGSAGFWPERGDDARTRHVNDLLAAAAARDPAHLFTVEPPAQFCTDPKISTSLSCRWDGVHYYKPGAALYFSNLIPQILARPMG
jgi:peptidoglycan/LPS O-acetylase OafA/YrhL